MFIRYMYKSLCIAAAPPHPPELSIISTTTTSIEVKLKPSTVDDSAPIHGYTLHYKPEFSDWETVQVRANLLCYAQSLSLIPAHIII